MPNRSQLNDNNVDELWQLLSVYADGEATPLEAVRVEALLESDSAYAAQYGFMKTARTAVNSLTELEPPVTLRASILAATTHAPSRWNRLAAACDAVRRVITPRFAISFAGLAAAGLMLFVVYNRNSRPPGASDTPRFIVKSNDPQHNMPGDVAALPPGTVIHTEAQPLEPKEKRVVPPILDVAKTPAPAHSNAVTPPLVVKNVHAQQASKQRPHIDDAPAVVQVAYRPGMDAQNERTPDIAPGDSSAQDEIQGQDVNIAETDTTNPSPSPSTKVASANTPPANSGVVIRTAAPITDILSRAALPPDPNQVFTKADMARNRAALTSGYDRSTVRSMERKEPSISLLHGTF